MLTGASRVVVIILVIQLIGTGLAVLDICGHGLDDPWHSDCDRQNAHAHLRAMLLGRTVTLAVADGEPLLGQYQSVIVAELDGPRERKLQLQVVGD
jgi:hypothetical protein